MTGERLLIVALLLACALGLGLLAWRLFRRDAAAPGAFSVLGALFLAWWAFNLATPGLHMP